MAGRLRMRRKRGRIVMATREDSHIGHRGGQDAGRGGGPLVCGPWVLSPLMSAAESCHRPPAQSVPIFLSSQAFELLMRSFFFCNIGCSHHFFTGVSLFSCMSWLWPFTVIITSVCVEEGSTGC